MREVIQLHIHIHISENGVTVSNTPPTQGTTLVNTSDNLFCDVCGRDLGIARDTEQARRKLGGHRKHCKGTPVQQQLREHVDQIFYPEFKTGGIKK